MFVLAILMLATGVIVSPARCNPKVETVTKYEQGRRYFESGDLAKAAGLFEEVLAVTPGNKSAQSSLLTCYRFLGIELYGKSRYEEAVHVWDKALAIDPDNEEIREYIQRCESESQAIANVTGDSAAVVRHDSHARQVGSEPPDPEPEVRESVAAEPVVPFIAPSAAPAGRPWFSCRLSSGLVFGAGDPDQPDPGAAFFGSVSMRPVGRRPSFRFECMYTRFYRSAGDAAAAPQHLAVSGLSVSAVAASVLSRASSLEYDAGLGVYELILTEPQAASTAGFTRRSSVLGVNVGLGWRKQLGPVAAIMNARYTYLYSSLSPNLLHVTVGLASN